MKIHSLKLTVQDVIPHGETEPVAAFFGDLYIDNGEFQRDEAGELVLNDEGMPIPDLEKISFTDLVASNPTFARCIQELVVEACMLRNIEIAKESGTFAHYLRKMTGRKLKKGSRSTKSKK